MKHNVLFVDDDPSLIGGLKLRMRKEPFEIHSACSGADGLAILERQSVDVVVSDEMMPGMRGTEFLARVKTLYPESIRIMLTGNATLETAIDAINKGEIYRFFLKPCNAVDLAVTIRQAMANRLLAKEAQILVKHQKRQNDYLESLGVGCENIGDVETDSDGCITISEEIQSIGYESLLSKMKAEGLRSRQLLSERPRVRP